MNYKNIIKKNHFCNQSIKLLVKSLFYGLLYKIRVHHRTHQLAINPPLLVDIEPTNDCNAKCIMCPHSKMKRKKGVMGWELFKRIADDCARFKVPEVSLNGFGEPLLDSLLIDRIKYLKKSGIPVIRIYTNAALLKGEIVEKLIHSGLDSINTCIDGVTKNVFEKIRPGLDLNIVEKNVIEFIKLRNKMGKKKPEVFIGFLRLAENEAEWNAFVNRWSPIADGIYRAIPSNWANSVKLTPTLNDDFHYQKGRYRSPCIFLWKMVSVQYNGDVALCCRDYEGKFILGNLQEFNLKDIWDSKKLKTVRQIHLDGNIECVSLCANCHSPDSMSPTIWWNV